MTAMVHQLQGMLMSEEVTRLKPRPSSSPSSSYSQMAASLPASSAPCPDWLDDAMRLIDSFRSYQDNWDSNNASRIKFDAINGAKTLLLCLASSHEVPQPMIYPTRSGGIQFEWEEGERYFEIEIVSSSAAGWYYCDREKQIEGQGEIFLSESLDELIQRIQNVSNCDVSSANPASLTSSL